jgi:hypothetical protein
MTARSPQPYFVSCCVDYALYVCACLGGEAPVWHAAVARGRLQPGERVLITGASGGVGSAAVLLAKAMVRVPHAHTQAFIHIYICTVMALNRSVHVHGRVVMWWR